MQTIEHEGLTLRRWDVGPSSFLARPEWGARLMKWRLRLAGGQERDIVHWPDEVDGLENLERFAKVRGGNPILFPFVARSFHQGEAGKWRGAHRGVLPMPNHGIARTSAFVLEEGRDDGFRATLVPGEEARACYPYDYRFTVDYRFGEMAVGVELELENRDKLALPWCAGHHFYFTLPWHAGRGRADYTVKIPHKQAFIHRYDEDGRLEKVSAGEETSFADPALRDRIHCRLKHNSAVFGPRSGEEPVYVRVGREERPPAAYCITTWTENEESPFYCVEPWMGPPNAPEHETGVHWVEPGQTASFFAEVSLL